MRTHDRRDRSHATVRHVVHRSVHAGTQHKHEQYNDRHTDDWMTDCDRRQYDTPGTLRSHDTAGRGRHSHHHRHHHHHQRHSRRTRQSRLCSVGGAQQQCGLRT